MKTKNQLIFHLSLHSIKTKYNFKVIPLISLLCVLMFIKMPALCQQFSPAELKFESQREAIAPVSYVDNKTPSGEVKHLL